MLIFDYGESDLEFSRWTHNLFRTFLNSGEMRENYDNVKPDILFVTSTALRVNESLIDCGIPLVLVHNEAWTNYWPPCGPEKFAAILGCCPLPVEPPNFISYPYYAVHFRDSIDELVKKRQKLLAKKKTKFCCFVVSNDRTGHVDMMVKRIKLFDALNDIKHVDSGGAVRNNVGIAPWLGFIDWVSDYKFMICLENTKSNPGYITEKPFTPWFAGAVPIYDGACIYELNQKALIDASGSIENIVKRVMELDNDTIGYQLMRNENIVDNIEGKFSLEHFEYEFRKKVLDKYHR